MAVKSRPAPRGVFNLSPMNSELHHYDVIVIGGGHAGRAGAVVDCQWQSTPVSAPAMDGGSRVS